MNLRKKSGGDGLARFLANPTPDRPVLVSGAGDDALAGLRDTRGHRLFSEERQATLYDRRFAALAVAPHLWGVAPWPTYDFRSLRRQAVAQGDFNRQGVIAKD